jgi:hypothetical protein
MRLATALQSGIFSGFGDQFIKLTHKSSTGQAICPELAVFHRFRGYCSTDSSEFIGLATYTY